MSEMLDDAAPAMSAPAPSARELLTQATQGDGAGRALLPTRADQHAYGLLVSRAQAGFHLAARVEAVLEFCNEETPPTGMLFDSPLGKVRLLLDCGKSK